MAHRSRPAQHVQIPSTGILHQIREHLTRHERVGFGTPDGGPAHVRRSRDRLRELPQSAALPARQPRASASASRMNPSISSLVQRNVAVATAPLLPRRWIRSRCRITMKGIRVRASAFAQSLIAGSDPRLERLRQRPAPFFTLLCTSSEAGDATGPMTALLRGCGRSPACRR